MSFLWHRAPLRVVLCGAPHSGKSSLFAALLRVLGPPVSRYSSDNSDQLRCAELSAKQLGSERSVLLIDTPGLCPEVAEQPAQRQAQAKILQCLAQSDILVHVVDAAYLGRPESTLTPVDQELYQYGSRHMPPAVVVAAKSDQAPSSLGIARLRQIWPQTHVVPVAVHSGRGLRELRSLLRTVGASRQATRPDSQGGNSHRF